MPATVPCSEHFSDHQDCQVQSDAVSDPENTIHTPSASGGSDLKSCESIPSPPITPALSDTSLSSSLSTTPANEDQQIELPFRLVTHPAVVYTSELLSDPAYVGRMHTVKVFDFDQTLFQSPLPNPALWDPSFLGILTSWNYCGTGWWHNPGTLDLGPEVEKSCWKGWWNEEVVKEVQESSKDPGCLTVLLTGRNGPTFGQKLIEMVQRKGLDFDLIATKPTTVALMENKVPFVPTKKLLKPVEKYLKVHTFNTKYDFLYNLLLEYPMIRSMHLWDDRPCQVAKFRQVGQEWLDNKMLDNFEITVVQQALLYMDPQREIELVLSMVEANNRQVDIEHAGGPFLVAGVGALPRTRPELKDRNIWDPYETYIPQARLKIEMTKIVRYTGVLFSEYVQRIMLEKTGCSNQLNPAEQWIERPQTLRGQDLSKWVVPGDLHVTLCLGPATEEYLQTIGGLGATVLVEVEALGEHEGRIWALKVKEMNPSSCQEQQDLLIVAPDGKTYSSLDALRSAYAANEPSAAPIDLNNLGHVILNRNVTPHITMAYDRLNGTRAVDSGRITNWEPLTTPQGTPYPRRLVFVGTIGEKRLMGMKARKLAQPSKAEVSVANVIKNLHGDKGISGKELGEMVRCVKEEMERLSVENRLANEERIATIAQEVCDRVETKKVASELLSQQHSPKLQAA
ncbi:hypothetical protein BC939DRAFT_460319 [Gamsiella multidivaricata]|uniref:uncharacterized protein n=1 Tax=Gamsiella multidivaricata TaxID=101098 RepID=UPI00221F2DFE|nr:uncharacterized protein BC939DRAFT_460319 [Gamsiella multidivaricata]KAG0368138.1 hypothetical protein BGZ54_002574 [Gamsiella multidivaricata]KAI7819285.1 hypothetical protein BC939DRAFT_460319 [Gamsiella multidivaricata]